MGEPDSIPPALQEPQPPQAPPPGGSGAPIPDQDARTMAMLTHLLGIFTGFVGPLIIWLIYKDKNPFVADQGKEALNFQITILLGYIIAGSSSVLLMYFAPLLALAVWAPLLALAVWVCSLVFSILGAMKANEGVAYRYPIAVRLIT